MEKKCRLDKQASFFNYFKVYFREIWMYTCLFVIYMSFVIYDHIWTNLNFQKAVYYGLEEKCFTYNHSLTSMFSLLIIEKEKSPWWMVDMGSQNCIGRVEVFNTVGKTSKYSFSDPLPRKAQQNIGESWGMANTFLLGLINATYMHDLKSLVYSHKEKVKYY